MGVGANYLRQYFLSIHPTWGNQPSDASALKKGVLVLKKYEVDKYYSGDINKWDVSLLLHVLRFTAVSSAKLVANPHINSALRTIQAIRNDVVAHGSDQKISVTNFKTLWKDLKQSLLVIGASEDVIDSTLTGKLYGNCIFEPQRLFQQDALIIAFSS